MSDVHAYRASDALAAALRAYKAEDAAFCDRVVEYDREHPDHCILWSRSPFSTDQSPVGFADSGDPVPSGLSRAKGRRSLIPRNGKTGEPWRAVLSRMKQRPSITPVWRTHGIRDHAYGPGNGQGGQYVAPTQWLEADEDGVLVVCKYDLARNHDAVAEPLSEHLTPIPLSEFYAIKERLEAEQAAATTIEGAAA